MKPRVSQAETYNVAIWMAGDIEQAKQICREHCFNVGLCVSVEPVTYIYTGGEEAGFRVGLINYPRFPKKPQEIRRTAEKLADRLMRGLCQHSYSITCAAKTTWHSRRPQRER